MLVLRPIELNDLNPLMDLLADAGHGLTSLPRDLAILEKRIRMSIASFADPLHQGPNGEVYLFVMEDLNSGELAGVCGIISKIGGFEPYYFYELKESIHESKMLKLKQTIHALHFYKTHSGPAEICSIFLSPKFRNSQNGRFLSLSRFLFIAEYRNRFEHHIIAEMRGMVDENGYSPFYAAVGQKFFHIPFTEADKLSMVNKSYVEDMLPKEPIVVELLPSDAQYVIGRVHPQTEPALKILQYEGFQRTNLLGIFEPGPIVKAELDELRSVKDSKKMVIEDIVNDEEEDFKNHHPHDPLRDMYIISNAKSEKYKCCLGKIKIVNQKVIISLESATSLRVKVGDSVRFVSLK
ncbi:MAG: arginine N-succinyltransferase [Bacteriovoracaceae bacterium]|nr:arginine N-succinyltransferase [Bacteriovoracaceae bacterium]